MHFRCVITMLKCCVLVGLDWAEPMIFLMLHVTCSCNFHAYVPILFYHIDTKLFSAFLHVSLSLSFFRLVALWHLNENLNPLHSGASSSSSPVDSTPSHVRFRNDKARKDILKNFSRQGIHLKRQVILSEFSDIDLPIVIYNRGWESLCGILFTCPYMIIQEFYSNMHIFDYIVPHFITRVRGMHIIVALDLIFEVLHVLRVEFADYIGYEGLRIVSKDEFSSRFCETRSSWGDCKNTLCSGFAKSLRFLNMVMAFVLHPLSHYNFITEPCARFFLSFLEGLTMDFSSHFILSLINIYRETTTCDKLIFPSAIT